MFSQKNLSQQNLHDVVTLRNRLKKEKFSLRFQLKASKLSDTSMIKKNRRDFARVLTRMSEILKKKG